MLRDLKVLYSGGSVTGLNDRQLIDRFRSAGSAGDQATAELALSALVDRHAAMVWNVCRSLIGDLHDAEDAFQATFLILVRKAATVRGGESLGPWLHVVAYRTALSVRAATARRRAVERDAASSPQEAIGPDDSAISSGPGDDLRAAVHAEIGKLPEAFRDVVILCDLEGLSYLEAAGRLRIPLGTVQSRLARARGRLRLGLARRGIDPADRDETGDSSGEPGLIAAPITAIAPAVLRRLCRLCILASSDPAQLRTTLAASVQALIDGGLKSMMLGTLKRVLVVGVGGAIVGGTLFYNVARSGQTGPDASRPKGRQAAPEGDERERIELPAPRALHVASGRGKTVLFALDAKGERIRHPADANDGAFARVEREIRWAAITGVIDHDRVQKALAVAERHPELPAEGVYCRVELARQTSREDGAWTRWTPVDMAANLDMLDRLPFAEKERIAERFLVGNLVDPLPALIVGDWRGVDVAEFLPAERKRRELVPIARPGKPLPSRDRPPVLMLRTLDFTGEPGAVYRYRARVVFFNRDRKRSDPKFRYGPWSEATEIVTIPRDQ